MNAKAKKLVKIILWAVGIAVGIPIVLLLSVPLWLGPVVKPSLNAVAPQFTKTGFRIEKLYLNPYTCNFELGGVRVDNPEGFTETNAVRIGYFNVDVDTASLCTDVIVVENVEVSDLYFSLVKKDGDKRSNLEILQENILGAKKAAEVEAEKEWAEHVAAERKAGVSEAEIKAEEAEVEREFNKKIIVRRLVFRNVSGKYGRLPFKVPSVELRDIGRDSGGYDLDHLFAAILKEFWASVMASAIDVSKIVGGHADKAWNAIRNVKDAESLKKAGDTFKEAGDALKGLFGK